MPRNDNVEYIANPGVTTLNGECGGRLFVLPPGPRLLRIEPKKARGVASYTYAWEIKEHLLQNCWRNTAAVEFEPEKHVRSEAEGGGSVYVRKLQIAGLNKRIAAIDRAIGEHIRNNDDRKGRMKEPLPKSIELRNMDSERERIAAFLTKMGAEIYAQPEYTVPEFAVADLSVPSRAPASETREQGGIVDMDEASSLAEVRRRGRPRNKPLPELVSIGGEQEDEAAEA